MVIVYPGNTISKYIVEKFKKLTPEEVAKLVGVPLDSIKVKDTLYSVSIFADKDKYKGLYEYNKLASAYIGEEIYGPACIATGAELDEYSEEFVDKVTPMNSWCVGSEFDEAMSKGLNNAAKRVEQIEQLLDKAKDVYGLNDKPTYIGNKSPFGVKNPTFKPLHANKIKLDIEKLYNRLKQDSKEEEEGDEASPMSIFKVQRPKLTQEEYDAVLESTYDALSKTKIIDLGSEYDLFEGDGNIVILDPDKAEDTICYLMQHFIDREEYEKCAVLRDIELVR